jgi:hypothetical protein
VKESRESDLWIAMVGIVSDWQLPSDLAKQFSAKYPDLLPDGVDRPEQALFATELGRLVRMFNFLLNGKTPDVNKSVRILTRMDDPYEMMNRETARSRLVGKRFDSINSQYEVLIKEAKESVKKDDPILLFTYTEDKMSFTSHLANELLYLYPKKVIIIARKKSGEMKCSLRVGGKRNITIMAQKALVGLQGYCGGHENACGAMVKEEFFDQFLEQLREEIAKE